MTDRSELFNRVKKGNDIMMAKYKAFTDFRDEWYENRKDGQDLNTLTFKLVNEEGFKGCLYGDNDCENRMCFVCCKGE